VIASKHSFVATLVCVHSESHAVIETINLNPSLRMKMIAFLGLNTGISSNTLYSINHEI